MHKTEASRCARQGCLNGSKYHSYYLWQQISFVLFRSALSEPLRIL